MHIRLLAVGDRQPAWVDEAFDNYSGRLPREWNFRIDRIATARRSKNNTSKNAMVVEADALLARIKDDEQVVLLDQRGSQLTSQALATRLSDWQADGRDLSFVIGGPDGVAEACRKRADVIWSLSDLTLPHGLARILFAEQMYRAWSLQNGHPYHRE